MDEYCSRIGVSTPGRPCQDVLAELQFAQLQSIPFENFDILLGRGIDLDPAAQVDKLLRGRRGGYCFELNGLFLRALQAAGFEARPLLARVHLHGEPTGRSHQVTGVTLAGRTWLVDTGFGSRTPPCPLPLEEGTVTRCGRDSYRMRGHALGLLLQVREDEDWIDLYSLDCMPVVPMDIVYGNHYTSTHPDSHFTRMRIAVIRRENGMLRLQDRRCTMGRGPDMSVIQFPDAPGYLDALEEHFGIALDVPYSDLPEMPEEE